MESFVVKNISRSFAHRVQKWRREKKAGHSKPVETFQNKTILTYVVFRMIKVRLNILICQSWSILLYLRTLWWKLFTWSQLVWSAITKPISQKDNLRFLILSGVNFTVWIRSAYATDCWRSWILVFSNFHTI